MEWLFLLLPVAAASGWWVGRRGAGGARSAERGPGSAYFRGLNYLLNEQPDKAIDVFLELAEVDRETAETHLALGALFRRRGEVDRAIRIHQDLIARPKLTAQQRAFGLYELGLDYMRAGLLDRAESLFKELAEMQMQVQPALRALIDIYQQEKDWQRCLETARQLEAAGEVPLRAEIAQFHCELAEQHLREQDNRAARRHLQDAQRAAPDCIRASLLQAEMDMADGDAKSALALYARVTERGPRFVPAMLPGLLDCYRRLGYERVAGELGQLFQAQPSPPLMLELSEALEREQGIDAAVSFLVDYLRGHADLSAAERLLDLRVRQQRQEGGTADPTAEIVLGVVAHLLSARPAYQCEHCGFEARALHWQCPSCKHWGSIMAVEPDRLVTDVAPLRQRRIT
ncbi:lipopolysaccharide assembly protein LapB [Thiorhodovibrio frisius]|uniref:Lipopolysaccharide assembly protein B n=1 Tax=Thiorhodovibrio frisius TaxID=631362 RepID=H8YY14_9GAMM|nr:lipopolysaccharide assembly protein LapB [Thiorhodovibrio frisius]EIC23340.1 putative N-acetylglucosaminyl transferase [Thiorhodovibrio frisius]WPL23580.1 tetratricopeptide repeat protein [Thiorhodovibrio frisius]